MVVFWNQTFMCKQDSNISFYLILAILSLLLRFQSCFCPAGSTQIGKVRDGLSPGVRAGAQLSPSQPALSFPGLDLLSWAHCLLSGGADRQYVILIDWSALSQLESHRLCPGARTLSILFTGDFDLQKAGNMCGKS